MTHDADLANRRILVIDDNPAIHDDFEKILGRGADGAAGLSEMEASLFGVVEARVLRPHFERTYASQGQQGVEMARQAVADGRPCAVAFVDMRMPPGWDGLETIEHLWAVDPQIQVVICSAYSDYQWADVLARLGNEDRLLVVKKPFDAVEIQQCANALTRKWQNERALKRHIEGLENVVTDRTEGLEAANRQLRHLASHDALTGLPNRLLLDDRLAQTITHAEREHHEFAVLVIDLDRFKLINDSLGHRAGDDFLKEAARRLKGVVRAIDTTARIGGDEFVMLLSGPLGRSDAVELGQRAIASLAPPVRLAGIDVHVSASIGLAVYPGNGTTVEALLAHADAAMYCAKERGRNNLQCYSAEMSTSTVEHVKFETELRQALARGEFELHYQPKVDTATGEVHSAEALIRWRHPERGLVPPDEFIPLADECGLIDSIGEWVVREACRQAKAWQREGIRPLRIAVNLAPSQFRLANLVEQIRQALATAELEPRFLEVELTETAVMSDAEESIAILEAISRMGVQVSVDDFGTGYSSMSYLRRFPVDKLKIDRSFISEVTNRPEDASIVQAIISLAHSLHLKVVAEGVETPEQLAFLKAIGCDQYQGFHFSPALAPTDFISLLRSSGAAARTPTEDWALRTQSKLVAFPRAKR
jgi:diguanylate cyclase (GGDEF)-like protein